MLNLKNKKQKTHRKRGQICGYERWGAGRKGDGGMWLKGAHFQL